MAQAILIGLGFTPNQNIIQDILRSGNIPKHCNAVTTLSSPLTNMNSDQAYAIYIRARRENSWSNPKNGLQATKLTLPDSRCLWLVYPTP